jgi:hypothetical protein
MSQANIPNITPTITVSLEESINMLLSSIALEEMALAHIVNAEAEKIQYVLGTLENGQAKPPPASFEQLLTINNSVRKMMHDVVVKEMLLLMKFENVMELVESKKLP